MGAASEIIDPARWVQLVWRVVYDVIRPGEDDGELYSDGAMGLLSAARLWNASHERKATFMTYADKCIHWQIVAGRDRHRRAFRIRGERRVFRFSELGDSFVRGSNRLFATVRPDWERNEEIEEAEMEVNRLWPALNDRQKKLIRLRFEMDAGGESLAKRGERFYITVERVRQIELKSLQLLRNAAECLSRGLPIPEPK